MLYDPTSSCCCWCWCWCPFHTLNSFNYVSIKSLPYGINQQINRQVVLSNLFPFCSLFKWHESHFILENRVETFATDDLFLYQADTTSSTSDGGSKNNNNLNKTGQVDTLLMIVAYTRQTNRKTRVNVYHIVNSKVEMLQHMYFQVNVLHPFTVGSQYYLLECSKRRK